MKPTRRKSKLISTLSVMILTCMFSYDSMGQNSVSIGTEDINEDAVLQLVSPGNDQGFLVPRMNSAQRLAMSPQEDDNGLLVYDYEQSQFFYWHDGEWFALANSAALTLTGTGATTVTGTYPDLVIHTNANDTSAINEIRDLQLNINTPYILNNTILLVCLINDMEIACEPEREDEENKEILLKGVTMGNDAWLNLTEPPDYHNKDDFTFLAKAGFNSIRFYRK